MFYGATPRDDHLTPQQTPRDGDQAGSALVKITPLSKHLESILRPGQSSRALIDALLFGVETAPFGPERLRKCEERREDSAAVLARLQHTVFTLTGRVDAISEEGTEIERCPGHSHRVRGRDEVVLAWVVGSCDALLKVAANLEAQALLSRRACRYSQSNGTPRQSPRQTFGSPRHSPREMRGSPDTPRGPPEGGVARQRSAGSTSYIEIHCEADRLRAEAQQILQSLSGNRTAFWQESWWRRWFFDVMCEACTTRQEVLEHNTQVSDVLNSIYARASQAARGDILCCAPVQADLDGVRYRALPEEDGRVLPKAVKRGKMVRVKGREGDWIFNSNGFLPLKHPVDGSALFLFDHRKVGVGDSEDSSGSDDPNAADASLPKIAAAKSKKNTVERQSSGRSSGRRSSRGDVQRVEGHA